MKTRLLILFLLSSTVLSAQWTAPMYLQFTYENYTNYSDFNEPIKAESFNAALLEAAIFYETNRQRVLNGMTELSYDQALNICAHDHSVDMVNYKFFSHTSVVEGKKSMSDRLTLVGYKNCWSGENIVVGVAQESYAKTARYLVEDLWMNSPGHRQNILNSKYSHLGTGAACYFDESWLMIKATQNFVLKK
jgi:uncharacterized protein YkwD